MDLLTKKERELEVFLDAANTQESNTPDALLNMADKMNAIDPEYGLGSLKDALLDSIEGYTKMHGHKPSMSLINLAVEQANIFLDSAVERAGSSVSSETHAFIPRDTIIAIQSVLGGAIPFGHYLSSSNGSGEAPLVILSHETGTKTGMYQQGASVDGIEGGSPLITTQRTHKLTSLDQTAYTGKINAEMTDFETCNQSGQKAKFVAGRTQILVNGLIVAESLKGAGGETFSRSFKLGSKAITVTGTFDGETVSVNFDPKLETTDVVHARGYLDTETKAGTGEGEFNAPEIVTVAEKIPMYASNYRAKVVCSPEARRQFSGELGIDPNFEGVMTARLLLSQENLYKTIHDACVIGTHNGLAGTFDLDWTNQKTSGRSQAQALQELFTLIDKISQKMANMNNSHGVSHIYVNDTMRALIGSLSADVLTPSGLTPTPGSYRLGRLLGKYEVYYTPKGLTEGASMLLIGANASNPALNPFIFGDVGVPEVKPISMSKDSPDEGYWLTGKAFSQQNPVHKYASSCAVITVTKTSLG